MTLLQGGLSTASGSTSHATPSVSVNEAADTLEADLEKVVDALKLDEPASEEQVGESGGAGPVTGNVGQNIDQMTFSSFFSVELEEAVQGEMKKLGEPEFEQLLEGAKQHPEFATFCTAVLSEGGLDETEWCFGEQEPYEDLVSFMIYVRGKATMQARLGMPITVAPFTMATVLQQCSSRLQEASRKVSADGNEAVAVAEPMSQTQTVSASQMAQPVPGNMSMEVPATQVFSPPATIPASLDVEMLEPQAPACMHDTVEATLVEASQAEPVEESQPLLPVPEPAEQLQAAAASVESLQTVPGAPLPLQTAPAAAPQASAPVQQLVAHAAPPSSQPAAQAVAAVSTQAQQHVPAAPIITQMPPPFPKAMIPLMRANNPHPLGQQSSGAGAAGQAPSPQQAQLPAAPAASEPPAAQLPLAVHPATVAPPPTPCEVSAQPAPTHVQPSTAAVVPAPTAAVAPQGQTFGKAPAVVKNYNKTHVFPPSNLGTQVDAVAEHVKKQNLPNSSTHRKEWATFMRRAQNPSVMPEALIPTFQTTHDKLDIFRLWLEKGMDFSAVEVTMRRHKTVLVLEL